MDGVEAQNPAARRPVEMPGDSRFNSADYFEIRNLH
jgi:hypothetical protein